MAGVCDLDGGGTGSSDDLRGKHGRQQ
jgi:hypothetical protein